MLLIVYHVDDKNSFFFRKCSLSCTVVNTAYINFLLIENNKQDPKGMEQHVCKCEQLLEYEHFHLHRNIW